MLIYSRNSEGNAAELLVGSYLAKSGHAVFYPAMGQSRVDLIYVNGFEPVKVQVKCSSKVVGSGGYTYEQARLARPSDVHPSARGYEVDEIDEFWIVGTHLWCFPGDLLAGKSSITLGSNNETPYRAPSAIYKPDDHIRVRGSWSAPFRERLMMNLEGL